MKLNRKPTAGELKNMNAPREWMTLKRLPSHLPQAVIAAEDANFYKHRGFDWDAMAKAYKHNEIKGRVRRGGSTITQQLAKNLYLTGERSYIRKVREGVITYFLELLLTKDRILEIYLNVIEFGPGVYGIDRAAEYHFGVSAEQLNVNQVCRLAAIIPSPRRYKINGAYVMKRAARIEKMIGK